LPSPTAESSGWGKQVKETFSRQFFWLGKEVLLAVGQGKKKKEKRAHKTGKNFKKSGIKIRKAGKSFLPLPTEKQEGFRQ
jgi:hypothetical protein